MTVFLIILGIVALILAIRFGFLGLLFEIALAILTRGGSSGGSSGGGGGFSGFGGGDSGGGGSSNDY